MEFNIVGKYNKLLKQSALMDSQIDRKRNIFRASLRKEFIESYQRSIRLKYIQMDKQERQRQQLKQTIQNTISNLQIILKMDSQQICTVDNFDYFIQSIDIVTSKKTLQIGNIGESTSYSQSNRNAYFQQQRMSNHGGDLMRNSNNVVTINSQKLKITNVWVHKQKIFSLLYRILDKVFTESNIKLKYVLDRTLYMLQFPELMPLWQNLSCATDQSIKNYCSRQFAKKLSKSSSLYSNFPNIQGKKIQSFNSILDPDFVLDILTNFIVQTPCINFENSIQLIPFISYSLNIKIMFYQKQQQIRQQLYPKLNKVCTILRSILKQDSKGRLAKMVWGGFGDIFIFLMQQTCKLFKINQKSKQRRQDDFSRMDQEKQYYYQNSNSPSPLKNRLECGYMKSCNRKQFKSPVRVPINLLMNTKINLVKLIGRIFVANSNISISLCLQQPQIDLFDALISQFLYYQNGCNQQNLNNFEEIWSNPNSDLYDNCESISLCDGHRILLNTTLSTISTILIAGSTSDNSFITAFLRSKGLQFLRKCLLLENVCEQYSKQIGNILLNLDSQNNIFYNKLEERDFNTFFKIELYLIKLWIEKYLMPQKSLQPYSTSSTNLSLMIQYRSSLIKGLKVLRNSLLMSYARATEPYIFQDTADLILCSAQYRQPLQQLSQSEASSNEQSQIRIISVHILQICNNPQNYLSTYNGMYNPQ